MPRLRLLTVLGPGLLVAATGVGAGDLATASIAGSRLGVSVLWAVVLGAFLKFVLNEGLARWQLVTGETLVEGGARRFGKVVTWAFLAYLLLWSFVVGRALVSACGVTAHALAPVFGDAVTGKVVFGALHSVLGAALVWVGGYRLFEKVMNVAIVVMVATVTVTALRVAPGVAGLGEIARGLLVPSIPLGGGEGLVWTVALLGGVGGTVTLLCYGYWIREEGLAGPERLAESRLDLAAGYAVTALFGVGMVIVGSTVSVEGGGAMLLVRLGEQLGAELGTAGKYLFLFGAWSAVASSLLGVWQSIPYLFADLWRLLGLSGGLSAGRSNGQGDAEVDTRGRPYRVFLLALALVSIAGLFSCFVEIQKIYAVIGALFIPALAAVLLVLNGRVAWVGEAHRNRPATTAVLVAALALFAFFGWVGWGSAG